MPRPVPQHTTRWSSPRSLGLLALVGFLVLLYTLTESVAEILSKSWVYVSNFREKPFAVYIYDLPNWLGEDVRTAPYQDAWLNKTDEYHADLWMYNYLSKAPFRTHDPETATLFYIPIFPTRYLHLSLHDTPDCDEAVDKSRQYSREGLEWVQQEWPYWKASRGRDHFLVLTADEGRCHNLGSLPRHVTQELFVFHYLGDIGRDTKEGPCSTLCYEPDRDILLPAYFNASELSTISPFANERPDKVIYRFDAYARNSGHPYHGVNVRQALLKHFEQVPLAGANWRVEGIAETLVSMTKSLTCITPPGVVAHTSRYWRAIQLGCMPVSFFRSRELPFQRYLDYSSFSINIDPYKVNHTHTILAGYLGNEQRIRDMQHNLESAQKHLEWHSPSGVPSLIESELRRTSKEIQHSRRRQKYG